MKKEAYKEMFMVEDEHWWYVTLHELVTLLSATHFSAQPLRILDAGCGTGGLLSILAEAGHDIEGFDYSEVALNFCQKRGLKKVFKADINNWVPGPNAYDVIASMDVLCHEWVGDEIKVLRTLASGLKANGLIMVNYPAFPLLNRNHDKVVMNRERYTKKTVKEDFAEAGLTPLLLSYRLPHAFVYLLLMRLYESIRRGNPEAKSDIAIIPSRALNHVLIQAGRLENRLIARGFSIPIGSSLFVAAKKSP